MKKKVLLSLLIIIGLWTITGCNDHKGKNNKTSNVDGKKYTCKEDYKSYGTLFMKSEQTAVVKNNILKKLIIKSNNKYADEAKYKESCKNNKDDAKSINSQNTYVTYSVTCNAKEKIVIIEKNYDVEKSLKDKRTKNMLSHTFDNIKEDKTFGLERINAKRWI